MTAAGSTTVPVDPATGAAPAIETRGLTAGYGHVPVLRDVNISAASGEVVAILGSNGAGKTTLLLTLAGEIEPNGGTILIDGVETRAPLHRRAARGLRFVTEERSVFPGLTTGDNLRLGGASPEAAVELFPELKPLLKRKARLLSGGEQQMLTLARAHCVHPRLLLADELSLGLAPMIVERLLTAVHRAAHEFGTAVVLVEQQVRQALTTADRAYVMRRGRVVLEGVASELLDRVQEIEQSYLSGAADIGDADEAEV
jgi:branched-chain amino acid transport system ATP-binding protein